MNGDPHKRCLTCCQVKHHAAFLPSRYTPNGLTDNCRTCIFANAQRDREARERREAGRTTDLMAERVGVTTPSAG